MDTIHYTLPEFKLSEPDQALSDFCARYPQPEARQRLWEWFVLALKDSRTGTTCLNTDLIAFYEDLKTLVSAVYQLHDLPRETATVHRHPQDPLPGNASLAAALERLHATVSHNWVLVVSPPE